MISSMEVQQNSYHPLVSVIMPLYRQESFILRAINSLIAQSFTHWELIIINDGSPGNITPLINSLQDSRIVYFEHSINKGLGASLNTGIDKARSRFIAYLPCDD